MKRQYAQRFQPGKSQRFKALQFIVTQNQGGQLRKVAECFVFQNKYAIIAQISAKKFFCEQLLQKKKIESITIFSN